MSSIEPGNIRAQKIENSALPALSLANGKIKVKCARIGLLCIAAPWADMCHGNLFPHEAALIVASQPRTPRKLLLDPACPCGTSSHEGLWSLLIRRVWLGGKHSQREDLCCASSLPLR